MAVKAVEPGRGKFLCLSTDTKPTAATHNCKAGDSLYVYTAATGLLTHYLTTDGTNWYQVNESVALVAASGVDIGSVGHNKTGIGHGVKTVTTAGTDVVLATSTAAKVVIIQAQTDNTGVIAVGGSGVDATVATGTGIALYAGDSVTLEIDNLADVYIDATVNGEGVRYTYLS